MGELLHFETFPQQHRAVFNLLASHPNMATFYLTGGTALALHIGHRQAGDLIFSTTQEFQSHDVSDFLRELGEFQLLTESRYFVRGLLNQVRISFLHDPSPLVRTPQPFHYLNIADMLDIALMKLATITTHVTKYDVVDLYFLLKYFSFEELLDQYSRKYNQDESVYDSLNYTLISSDEMDQQPMPLLYHPVRWDEVRTTLLRKVHLQATV